MSEKKVETIEDILQALNALRDRVEKSYGPCFVMFPDGSGMIRTDVSFDEGRELIYFNFRGKDALCIRQEPTVFTEKGSKCKEK